MPNEQPTTVPTFTVEPKDAPADTVGSDQAPVKPQPRKPAQQEKDDA